MLPELAGQRDFNKLPPLPRRPELNKGQQEAVDAYFELDRLQQLSGLIEFRSIPSTIADAYIIRSQAGGGRVAELQQKIDRVSNQIEYNAAITYEIEVRTRASEALQLERQAFEAGLVFLQMGTRRELTDGQRGRIQADIADDLRAWTERRKSLLEEPAVFDRYRLEQLATYKAQLNSPDRFVELPSRLDFEREIISVWLNGQSILVAGYTGTGKSELVKHAALTISKLEKGTAEYPVVIRASDEAMLQDFLGDIQLEQGKTVYSRGPAAQALTDGRVVQLEEANLLPNDRHLTVRDMLNRSAGQKISLPNTDPMSQDKIVYETVGRGYHYAATQNPKSDKYERQDTWAEVDRAYGHPRKQLYYMPSAEVYDLAVACLMDDIGGIPLSQKDLIGTKQADGSYNGTLVVLCNLAQEFQNAYTGQSKTVDGGLIRGSEELGKLIVDPAKLIAIVEGFANRPNQTESFNTYVSNRFLAEFINNTNYPARERIFVLSRMIQNGFFKGFKSSEFEITGEGITRAEIDTALMGQVKAPDKYDLGYVYPETVARLDPYKQLAQLRTRLNLTNYATDSVAARNRVVRQTVDATSLMGLNPVTPEQTLRKQPKPSSASPATVGQGTNLEELQRYSRRVRRAVAMTKILRNTPPPFSFVLPYGRDMLIPMPDFDYESERTKEVFWFFGTAPINLVASGPAWTHRRQFRKALDKRQALMLDTLQRNTGIYPVIAWVRMARSYNDLKVLSEQSFRPGIDSYGDYNSSEARKRWKWDVDPSLVTMIANRFPKLHTSDEVISVWKAVFGARSLIRRRDVGQDEFKIKLANELCSILLTTQDTSLKQTARRYLNILATRITGKITDLERFASAQNAASVKAILTK